MLLRKAIAAYLTSFTFVIYYSLLLTGIDEPNVFPRFDQLMQWISFISLYVFPIVLIYGSFVSMAAEYAVGRWVKGRAAGIAVSCGVHIAFGALFALPFRTSEFTLLCALGALLFYGVDRLMCYCIERGWKKKAVPVSLALPIAAIAALGAISGYSEPEQPPFNEEAAVRFATSGSVTVIDVFPKKVGATHTELNGYKVTRETSVSKLGHEEYEIAFREQWSNGTEQGERWFTYTVSRGGMTSKDSGGDTPPY